MSLPPVAVEARDDLPEVPEIPEVTYAELTPATESSGPPLPDPQDLPVQLVLDDDSAEGVVGIGALNAQQFLWFQAFSPGTIPFELREIWVLFPQDPNLPSGAAIQLVIYSDPDGDPTSGADLLAVYDRTVQAVDGATFSAYELDEPLWVPGGDVLIGVINRYAQSGIDPPSRPAALDTSASAGRSWLAVWSSDPPNPPELPPDLSLLPIDSISPGNWMIRGFGTRPEVIAVPSLGPTGLWILVGLLAWIGQRALRRLP